MTPLGETVLLLVLVAVAAFVIPLFVQLRRTAAKMEILAESAQRDLHQMAEDLHETKVRMDEVSTLVKQSLELPAALSQALVSAGRAFSVSFGHMKKSPNWIDALVTGLQFALSFKNRSKTGEEEAHG